MRKVKPGIILSLRPLAPAALRGVTAGGIATSPGEDAPIPVRKDP